MPPRSPSRARPAARRCCASPTSRSTRRRCGRPSRRARASSCSTRRTTRRARSSRGPSWSWSPTLAREHDAWVVTDEVYEHLVFDDARARADGDAAGDARPHHHDQLGRQDVLGHRLEGRLAVRAGRGGRGRAHRQAVPHLRRVRAVPAGRGAGPRARRRGVCRAARTRSRPSATCCARRSRRRACRWPAPSGTYFVIADAAPAGGGRRAGVRAPTAGHRRGGGGAGVGLPRRRGRGAHVGPVRLLQEGRGAARGQPPPRRCRDPAPPDPAG